MRGCLRGTVGCLLQVVLSTVGIGCLLFGWFAFGNHNEGEGVLLILLGVLFIAAEFGVRRWLREP
jgi:membrane-bound ClpP family serine protease